MIDYQHPKNVLERVLSSPRRLVDHRHRVAAPRKDGSVGDGSAGAGARGGGEVGDLNGLELVEVVELVESKSTLW